MKRRDVLKGLAALAAAGPAVAEAATRTPAPVASESGFAVAAALGQYDHLGGGERYITERYITPLPISVVLPEGATGATAYSNEWPIASVRLIYSEDRSIADGAAWEVCHPVA